MNDDRAATEAIDDAVAKMAGASAKDGVVSRFVSEGAEVVYEVFGSGEPVFVLIHGIGMGRGVFADLISGLTPLGRVIAIDLPGYGESPEPWKTPTMERLADIVAGILRHDGTSSVIAIGHSMGTQVVTELAVRHPELVKMIVLIAPTVDQNARSAARQLSRLLYDLVDDGPKVVSLGAREYLRAGPNLIPKMHAMLVHEPEKSYPRVTQPALVLRGEKDAVVPHDWAETVASLLPNGTLEILTNTGHQSVIRSAEPGLSRIMRFVRRG